LRRVRATRYVTPLREGGSLPGIVEAEDLGIYVCKFRGAGQGLPVLVAEVIVSELARRLDLRTPMLVALELEQAIARYEADEEVQDLLNASLGLNLGVDFLPGSFGFDPTFEVDPDIAARTLWLDALVANVDRSWRNPNLLVWHGDLWLIDHGASLYFHHGWSGGIADPARFAAQPYDVSDHVFGAQAARAAALDDELSGRIDATLLTDVLALVPDEWLEPRPGAESPDEVRAAYVAFLRARLEGARVWVPGRAAA
jgi:hypothetical protein